MVKQLDGNEVWGFKEGSCELNMFRGGGGMWRRMIMKRDKGRGRWFKRLFKQVSGVENR